MLLRCGKLYKTKEYPKFCNPPAPFLLFYFMENQKITAKGMIPSKGAVFLFLEKGKYISEKLSKLEKDLGWNAYTPYYFLVRDKIMIFKKTYNKRLCDYFEEIKIDNTP